MKLPKIDYKGIVLLGVFIVGSVFILSVTDKPTKENPRVYIFPNITESLIVALDNSDSIYCLQGVDKGNIILIYDFIAPKLRASTPVCIPSDSIGIITSHPGRFSSCQPNPEDIYNMGLTDSFISAISCKRGNQFSFYTLDSPSDSLEWVVGYK